MKAADIKIGMKVVPHSKSGQPLSESLEYQRTHKAGNAYLYVSKKLMGSDTWVLNHRPDDTSGDYFHPSDFKPYEDLATIVPAVRGEPKPGINPHQPGAKLDQGKLRMDLVLGGFPNALQEVAKVGTFGAKKYTDDGWKQVDNGEGRYTDAMLRHYFAEKTGELLDPESEILHAAHLAWNALARLELSILKKKERTLNN